MLGRIIAKKFAGLRDPQKRDRYFSLFRKRLLGSIRRVVPSRPIFIFGTQRSGTSMLMYAFHRHPKVEVYDEHHSSKVFCDYRVRSLDAVSAAVETSSFPIVCFKPICDSHLIGNFVSTFPDAHHIWIYRGYADVANSNLRKFRSPTRAIRLVCTGETGGGWFQEGISGDIERTLKAVYDESLSDFDLCCLVWWARNKTITERGFLGLPSVSLVRYESLVTDPSVVLQWLFNRAGVPFNDSVYRRISPRSINRFPVPTMNKQVASLCQSLMSELEAAYFRQF